MHEHSYIGCEHELKHCSHCDVVYCEKCRREWKQTAAINTDWFKGWRTEDQYRPQQQQWPTQPPFINPTTPIGTGTPIPTPQQTWCHTNPNPDTPKAG